MENTHDHRVNCFHSLNELSKKIVNLFNSSELNRFDSGIDWFKLLARTTFDENDCVKVYVVSKYKKYSMLALPLKAKKNHRELWSLTNFYTTLYAPAVDQESSGNLLTACFTAIRKENPAWTALRLQPLDRDSNEYKKFIISLRQSNWLTFEFFCFGNWYLPVPTTGYDEVLKNLPSRTKNTLKRKRKQFLEKSNGKITIITNDDDLDIAISDYARVYAASWKRPEPYPEFIPGLIRLCAARGWLRLGLAYIDGEIAAAQIWIVQGGRAAIYKLAYDARFEHYSVGTILTDHLMRHVIEVDQVQEVDYLIGDDAYKRDWMSHRRERWGVIAYNPRTLAGLGGASKEFARRQAKRLRDWLTHTG